jgi:hypothetical protein
LTSSNEREARSLGDEQPPCQLRDPAARVRRRPMHSRSS